MRGYNGPKSRWYQSAVRQKAGRITAADMTKEVSFEPVAGAINDRIDDTYRTKYHGSPIRQPDDRRTRTRRDRQSDQLSAFYPGAQLRDLKFAGIDVEAPVVYEAAELDRVFVRARRVTLRLVAAPRGKEPDVEVSYTLEDGWPCVLVSTTFSNRGTAPVDTELVDAIRADRSFELAAEAPADTADHVATGSEKGIEHVDVFGDAHWIVPRQHHDHRS